MLEPISMPRTTDRQYNDGRDSMASSEAASIFVATSARISAKQCEVDGISHRLVTCSSGMQMIAAVIRRGHAGRV